MANGMLDDHDDIDDDEDDDDMYGMEDDDDDVVDPGGQWRCFDSPRWCDQWYWTVVPITIIGRRGNNGNNKKKKRKDELTQLQDDVKLQNQQPMVSKDPLSLDPDDDLDRDGGSIFGATTGTK